MNFVWGLAQVLIGSFVLFTIARIAYGRLVPHAGWGWVLLVGVLAIGNMLLHRWLGSTINPPFFTSVLFGITLIGIAPDKSVVEGKVSAGSQWYRRGIAAVVAGTVLGWLSYAEIGTLPQ
jgi:hypothetical protein